MARIPYAQDPKGRPARTNISRMLANAPGVSAVAGPAAMYIRHESPLDPRLRELAILQIGYLTRTEYEYAHHIKIALDSGVSEADIHAMIEESEGRKSSLDSLAATVLRAAREMTADLGISRATFAELHPQLGDELMVELVYAIASYNGVVRILRSFEVDLEDEYRSYLARFPLP